MPTDQIAQWKAEASRLRKDAAGLPTDIRDDLLSIARRYDLLIECLQNKYGARSERVESAKSQ